MEGYLNKEKRRAGMTKRGVFLESTPDTHQGKREHFISLTLH